MSQGEFDLIVIGGGVSGAALGTVLARAGIRVLILERELEFRDRNRGEWLAPWGVREARLLGLLGVLDAAGGHPLPALVARSGEPRTEATPEGDIARTFYHPAFQEALLEAAGCAGAKVLRGANVTAIDNEEVGRVHFSLNRDQTTTAEGRVLVGADGRTSLARRTLGKLPEVHRSSRVLAGVRAGNVGGDPSCGFFITPEDSGSLVSLFPQGDGHARCYLFVPGADAVAFAGPSGFANLIRKSIALGVPADVLGGATQAGPLASFVADDSSIPHPSDGALTLIGDAAGLSDPTWGMGLALALRDARALSSTLVSTEDWRKAIHTYADHREAYWTTVITAEAWQSELHLTAGPAAVARRHHALGLWKADPSRILELPSLGPDLDVSEQARARFFGEDVPAA